MPQGVNTVSDLTVGTINSVPDTVDAFVDFGTQSGNITMGEALEGGMCDVIKKTCKKEECN